MTFCNYRNISKWRLFRVPFPGLPKDVWCCSQSPEKIPATLKRALENDSYHQNSSSESESIEGSPSLEPKRKRFRGQGPEIHVACFDNDLENVIDAHLVSKIYLKLKFR